MAYTEYFDYTTGLNLYAKTKPLNATWATGVITLTENAATGEYSANTFVDYTEYSVYQRLGGSPASSDTKIGTIYPPFQDSTVAADIDAIKAKTDLIGTAAAPITTHDGGSLYAVVGSTANATIVCSEDISAKTVQVVFETVMSKTDVATIANASVTKVTTSATFALPSAATASERTLRVTVRDTTSFKAYGSAILFVTYDAKGD